MPTELLGKWVHSADLVWAADGASDRLLEMGLTPAIIVGDLDSASQDSLQSGAKVLLDASQEVTDCDKLLALASVEGFSSVTLASVEGDLPDHFLATLQSASRAALQVRLALRRGVGWVVRAGENLNIETSPGRRLSFLPLTEATGACLTGVAWELTGVALHPNGFTSVSNRTSQRIVTAGLEAGAAFLFVEYPEEEIPFW